MANTASLSPAADFRTSVQSLFHEQLRERAPDTILCVAFDVVQPLYTVVLRRFAGRYLDAGEADDLVQEVWVRALVRLTRSTPLALVGRRAGGEGSSLRAWLGTVLRNLALNMIRAKKRHPVQLGCERELSSVVDRSPGPAEQLEAQWERDRAASILPLLQQKLFAHEYRLLELCCIEERTPREAAKALGIKAADVSARKYRLLKKVRRILGTVYGEQ